MSVTTTTPSPKVRTASKHRVEVQVRGHNLDVLTLGNPADEPIVFLHGFGANPFIYIDTLHTVANRGRYVIAPALPSFGKSQPLRWGEQNVNGVANHIIAFFEQHLSNYTRSGPVDLVGHSFGGGVALRITATRPDLVKSLTLFCPVGGATEGAIGVRDIVEGILTGDAGQHWLTNGVHHFLPALARHTPGVLATGLSAWFADQHRDAHTVANSGIPTRFYYAEGDRLVRQGATTGLHSTTLTVEVQHGRHSWLIDEPDRFVDLLFGTDVNDAAA